MNAEWRIAKAGKGTCIRFIRSIDQPCEGAMDSKRKPRLKARRRLTLARNFIGAAIKDLNPTLLQSQTAEMMDRTFDFIRSADMKIGSSIQNTESNGASMNQQKSTPTKSAARRILRKREARSNGKPKQRKVQRKQPQKSSDIRNDKPFIHYSNPKYTNSCAICSVVSKNAVAHYKRQHPNDEVFISRLSTKFAERATTTIPRSTIRKGNIPAMCYFCESVKRYSRQHWPIHIQGHTGEWNHFCTGCKEIVPNSGHPNCSKPGAGLKKLRQYTFSNGFLQAFMCRMCNYVQTIDKNMQSHLEIHHSIRDPLQLEENYLEINLISSEGRSRRSRDLCMSIS